jgi:hypothetical protein
MKRLPILKKHLAIGHVYKWRDYRGYGLEFYLEHNCYHIRRFEVMGYRIAWDTFDSYLEAREALTEIKERKFQQIKRVS